MPTVLSKGPWYENTLHGSAMLAAIAHAAEQHHTDVPRQVVRLTVDMMRAAPMVPLRVETSTARSGKGIDIVDISMYADDVLYVRGTALRIRLVDLVVDDVHDTTDVPTPPSTEQPVVASFDHPGAENPAFHHAIDTRLVPADDTVWFRLAVPVVDDEPNTGFVTIATIADWTYSVPRLLEAALSEALPAERTVYAINADTTVNTHRPLSGEWLGVRARMHIGSVGAGTSSAELFDVAGPVGFTTQSVLLRGPSGAPLSVKELSAQ